MAGATSMMKSALVLRPGPPTILKTAIYRELQTRNRPSFYATPVAWGVANFVQLLIGAETGIAPRHTGLIVVSDECSLRTILELARSAAQGMISPLKFAGSSPSIVAGLPALEQGIRGPTLALTMPPRHASSAIVALITYWMLDSEIGSVIAIAHYEQDDRRHAFKGLIARSLGKDLSEQVHRLCDPHTPEA